MVLLLRRHRIPAHHHLIKMHLKGNSADGEFETELLAVDREASAVTVSIGGD